MSSNGDRHSMEKPIYNFKMIVAMDGNSTPVIQRFPSFLPRTYDVLCSQLKKEKPLLSSTPFQIFWKDEDGDSIEITSDRNMKHAFTLMLNKKDLITLYVYPKATNAGTQKVHYGITCDTCNMNPIIGRRFKCTVCFDFDVCSNCDRLGKHQGHIMLAI